MNIKPATMVLLLSLAVIHVSVAAQITDDCHRDAPSENTKQKAQETSATSGKLNIRHTTKLFERPEKVDSKCMRTLINENMEKSYITPSSGVRMGGDQTADNMLYEAQIFTNLEWFKGNLPGGRIDYWLDVPIRIGVRQFDDNSLPVRTPSFNPGLRAYFWWNTDNTTPLFYASLGLHHYSNGQDGDALRSDGTVNTKTGSFSTNYVELAGHMILKTEGLLPQWYRLAVRQHFIGTWDAAQPGQYEKGDVSLKVRTREFLKDTYPFQFTFTGAYGYGRDYIIKNDVAPSQDIKAHFRDKWNFTTEFTLKPTFGETKWTDLALYVRYDYGYDYYNINFQHKMNRLQIGIASTNY